MPQPLNLHMLIKNTAIFHNLSRLARNRDRDRPTDRPASLSHSLSHTASMLLLLLIARSLGLLRWCCAVLMWWPHQQHSLATLRQEAYYDTGWSGAGLRGIKDG